MPGKSPVPLRTNAAGRQICGAKTRSGGMCQNTLVMPNGRCRMHGGKSLSGTASPLFKTGRYSKDLPTRILPRFQEALGDPELLSTRADIAFIQSLISDRLAAWADEQGNQDWTDIIETIQDVSKNWRTWDSTKIDRELKQLVEKVEPRRNETIILAEVRDLINQRSRLAQQEHRRLIDLDQVLTIEQVVILAQAIAGVVAKYVTDLPTRQAINNDVSRLVALPGPSGGR